MQKVLNWAYLEKTIPNRLNEAKYLSISERGQNDEILIEFMIYKYFFSKIFNTFAM